MFVATKGGRGRAGAGRWKKTGFMGITLKHYMNMYAYFLCYINESLLYSKEEGAGREPVGERRRWKMYPIIRVMCDCALVSNKILCYR